MNYEFHYFTSRQMIVLKKKLRRMAARTTWLALSIYSYLEDDLPLITDAHWQSFVHYQIVRHCRHFWGGVNEINKIP